jgi:putative PIN family toxin of toxin-antitoxin system
MKKESKSYRVIIDSNIWISFLIGKNLIGLQNHIDSQKLKIVTCNEQLVELSEVFKKPKFRKYFTKEQITEFFELLDESSECIIISTKTIICRDPKDNYLVSLALDSIANFLISGDKDLLDLNKIEQTIVLKYSDFDTFISSNK